MRNFYVVLSLSQTDHLKFHYKEHGEGCSGHTMGQDIPIPFTIGSVASTIIFQEAANFEFPSIILW